MAYTKLKLAIGITAGILLAGGATTMLVFHTRNDEKLAPLEIIKDTQNAYAALSSYSDTGTTLQTVGSMTITNTFKIRLARPNLYRIEWEEPAPGFTNKGAVWSAGNGDFLLTAKTGHEQNAKRSKEQDMASNLSSATASSGSASSAIPGTFFGQNWGNITLKPLASGRSKLTRQKDENVGGFDCLVVAGDVSGKNGANMKMTLWIGKRDFLIHQSQQAVAGLPRMPELQAALSDSEIRDSLSRAGKPATPEAIAAMRKQIQDALKATLATLNTGNFSAIQTHENIVVNQKFSPADFSQ